MAEEMAGAAVGGGEVTDDDRLWALLSWLFWPVGVVVLFMDEKKNRPFVKYNAVLSLAFWVVTGVVGAATVGCLAIIGIIYAIVLAIKAYQGEWVEVPFLSDFVKKQGWV